MLPIALRRISFFGGQGQNRTADTKIFSLLLYRLSYLPTARTRARIRETTEPEFYAQGRIEAR